MGRTRENRITESAAELRRLAKRYAGRAQESRLLFIIWVKENPGCTIRQAAERAGITERHGRYLWEDYCNGGVERVIARRIGRRKREEPAPPPPEGTVAGMTAADMVRFMNAVGELGGIDDPYKWARRLGDILMECIPEVDYAVVSISHNPISRQAPLHLIFHQHHSPSGQFTSLVEAMSESKNPNFYSTLIEHGKQQGFPFSKYHSPPIGFDMYSYSIVKDGKPRYLGSILLFKNVEQPSFSLDTLELCKTIFAFLELVFTEFILRLFRANPSWETFSYAVDKVAKNKGLTDREQDVLLLLLLGHTHEEIAELLKVTPATVNKHTRSVYKKAGVRRLSEFFARYFTPRDYFPERGEEKGKEE